MVDECNARITDGSQTHRCSLPLSHYGSHRCFSPTCSNKQWPDYAIRPSTWPEIYSVAAKAWHEDLISRVTNMESLADLVAIRDDLTAVIERES